MKKYLKFKIMATSVLVFTCSCSVANSINQSDDCIQEYNKIVTIIKNNSTKPKSVNPYNSDLEARLSQLLPACPKHAGLKVIMANVQISLGKNIVAQKYVNEALSLEPNYAEAIHVKGVLLSLEGKVEDSLRNLKRSLDLEPDNIDFLVNYCSTLESFGRYENAIKICSQAVQSAYVPPAVFYIRGRAYEGIGQKAKAQLDYDKARELGFDM